MATNFLNAAGTSGFIVTPFNLLTTELNALANAAVATSSVGGTSGVFTQTSFGSAVWCKVWFVAGGAFGTAPAAGANISGWWDESFDGGTTFELTSTTIGLPRPPDFVIPLIAGATYANTNVQGAAGLIKTPFGSNKVVVLNGAGFAMAASGNKIMCGPVAIQY